MGYTSKCLECFLGRIPENLKNRGLRDSTIPKFPIMVKGGDNPHPRGRGLPGFPQVQSQAGLIWLKVASPFGYGARQMGRELGHTGISWGNLGDPKIGDAECFITGGAFTWGTRNRGETQDLGRFFSSLCYMCWRQERRERSRRLRSDDRRKRMRGTESRHKHETSGE